MKCILYTQLDGVAAIHYPSPKQNVERVMGVMTQEEYEAHIWKRAVPQDAINPKYIDISLIPENKEFRGAWCNVTEESRIDIDCAKARDIKLEQLRVKRNEALDALDKEQARASDLGLDTTAIKTKKQKLRDATNGLKALVCDNVYNDENLLQSIRDLSVLENVIN